VLARLLRSLPPGGVLAVQMPDNTNEPALMLMEPMRSGSPIRHVPTAGSC
jgi:trans-aconitate methyltransferase